MFKFKLASVLSLREKMEDSKKRELGLAVMLAEQVREEKRQLELSKEACINEAKNENMGMVNVQYFRAFNQYSQRLDQEIEKKGIALSEAEQNVADKREALLEAVKQRKILDNLKAIEQEAYIEEEKREEQKILDDIVTYKYGNKGKE